MYVTTNSTLVWKRVADEHMQSARLFGRLCTGLLVLLIGTGAYAYSTHARYNDLCTTIEIKSKSAEAPAAKKLGNSITSVYCT